ncbi:MAG: beta-lactamase family protein [Cytophagales bacterium]|nr:beta-lactamase family protein [Cytophagales bacterium]
MKKSSLSVLLILLLSCQPPVVERIDKLAAVQPESAGFSSQRLARIDSMLTHYTNQGWINGAVAFVAHDSRVVYHKAIGYNDLQTRQPLKPDDIFRIASQTKAITSVAAMMLYEEGKFLLDDPVATYIPAFAKISVLEKFNPKDTTYTTVPAKRPITVRDLLTHTSGIGYAQIGSPEANSIYAKNKITAGLDIHNDTLEDAINRLASLPLMHQPGERWTYGLNTDVLGRLVEVWSGTTLEKFFHDRIFQPLGMNDTYFNLPQEKAERLVNFFITNNNGQLEKAGAGLGTSINYPLQPTAYFSGGAGLSSTIYDYAIFLQMLLNGGEYNGARILSRNSVRMMTMNQIGDLNLGDNKFGLGFSIVTEKGSSMLPHQQGTFSWGGAFSTTYWVDPKERLVVLLYRQMWGPHREIDDIYKVLVYQSITD